MVEPVVATGALECEDVQRLLHDADRIEFTHRVGADDARIFLSDVLADGAKDDLLLQLDDRLGERTGFGLGRAEEVVGEALSALGPDAGELVKRLDEAGHGWGGRGCAAWRRRPVIHSCTLAG